MINCIDCGALQTHRVCAACFQEPLDDLDTWFTEQMKDPEFVKAWKKIRRRDWFFNHVPFFGPKAHALLIWWNFRGE